MRPPKIFLRLLAGDGPSPERLRYSIFPPSFVSLVFATVPQGDEGNCLQDS
jgi:hypothetical protein